MTDGEMTVFLTRVAGLFPLSTNEELGLLSKDMAAFDLDIASKAAEELRRAVSGNDALHADPRRMRWIAARLSAEEHIHDREEQQQKEIIERQRLAAYWSRVDERTAVLNDETFAQLAEMIRPRFTTDVWEVLQRNPRRSRVIKAAIVDLLDAREEVPL